MGIDLAVKVAAFCRELGDSALADLARSNGLGPLYQHAEQALRAGRIDPQLETQLDALDAMVRRTEGKGLYPSATWRAGYPGQLPGAEAGSGARWWVCPRAWCAGHGRVRSGQLPPRCAASGDPLTAGPLPG
ncbi:hypothetical protein ACH40F_09735 [Streptomyces sp. NPDC020794]|uniref:hypothetical protein n=1 Tax=unclassified Streptomyces TaxID=2593676 RepID=UPI0036E94E4F